MAARKINQKQKQTPKTKRSSAKAAAPGSGNEIELSPAQMRELEQRILDLSCRTRYMIVGVLDPNFVLYYNVSEDTYGWNDPTHATLFKRRKAAQTILQLIGDKDTLVECQVNKRGQLVKKSVTLPSTSHRPKATKPTSAATRRPARTFARTARPVKPKRTSSGSRRTKRK